MGDVFGALGPNVDIDPLTGLPRAPTTSPSLADFQQNFAAAAPPPQRRVSSGASLSAHRNTPSDYLTSMIASALSGTGIAQPGADAYRQAQPFTNLANFSPLGIPQAMYDAGQTIGHGIQQGPLTGAKQIALGTIMGGLGVLPGGGELDPEIAAALRKYSPAGPGEINPAASPWWMPQRVWSLKAGRVPYQAGDAPPLVDMATAQAAPKGYFDKLTDLFRNYPNMPQDVAENGSATDVANTAIDHIKNNLKALYNSIPEADRQNTMQWYDGANRLVKDWAQQYNLPEHAVAGMVAALSPKRDWFQNVSLAQRMLDLHFGNNNLYSGFALSPEMENTFATTNSLVNTPEYRQMFDLIKGKSLGDIDKTFSTDEAAPLKALWTRLYDETHNDRSFRSLNADGTFGDFVTNQDGSKTRIASGTLDQYANALQLADAAKTGDMVKFSDYLGDRHKVRNFYNNIIDPMSPLGDITVDTHAVAAGLLRPLSQAHAEVLHNFRTSPQEKIEGFVGAPGSDPTGLRGTYPVYADAYRQAASELGLAPRQLQSITWEGVRKLFPDTFKNDTNLDAINGIWNDYRAGNISQQEAQNRVFAYAKQKGTSAGDNAALGNAVDPRQLGPPESLGGSPQSVDVGGRGAGASVAPSSAQRPEAAAPAKVVKRKLPKGL